MSLTSGSLQSRVFFRLMLIVLLLTSVVPFGYSQITQSTAQLTPQVPIVTPSVTVSQPDATVASQNTNDLGSAIYEGTSNPVSGKLPDTAATVPNPVDSAYKNPFE